MAESTVAPLATERKETEMRDLKDMATTQQVATEPELEKGDILKAPSDHYAQFEVDGAYAQKAHLINQALHEIGMNGWQYKMWILCGFGWIVDNIAGYGMSVTYTPVSNEFSVPNVTITGIAYNIGAFAGAMFWGPMADIIGRRWAFNITLFLVGIFMLAAGGASNIYAYGVCFGIVGFASGGNVPVSSVVYLEFVPSSGHWLLTILSAWWAVGAVLDALIAWAFVGNYSCDMDIVTTCTRDMNMGWRYTLFTVGAIVIVLGSLRFFFFRFPESPYYLISRGHDAEAVEVISWIAHQSKKPCTLTLEMLQQANSAYGSESITAKPSTREIFISQFKQVSFKKLKPLFTKPKLALHTSLIIWIWAAIGVAYPLYSFFLPVYLAAKFSAIDQSSTLADTYKQYCYIAACTVPGPIIAGFVIETRLGRRYTMSIGTIFSGVFLYLSTLANSNNAVVAWNCVATLVVNFMFAIQYAYTPESFPPTIRATMNGLCSMVGYVCGIAAPVISSQAGVSTNVPIYVSGALFLVTGVLMGGLPFETAPNASL